MTENIFQTCNSINAGTYVCSLIVDYWPKSFPSSLICYHQCESIDVFFKSFTSFQVFGYDVIMKVFGSIKVSHAFYSINTITFQMKTVFYMVKS